jgi:hypothetical protein
MFAGAAIRVTLTPEVLGAGGNTGRGATTRGAAATRAATGPHPADSRPPAGSEPVDPPGAYEAALAAYLRAHETLTRDKSEGVAARLEEAAKALEPLRQDPALAPGVDRLATAAAAAKGQTLDALRQTFKEASAAMIETGRAAGTPADASPVKVFRCPMKKANWLQNGNTTANPYYGSEMFDCGSAIETLPKARKKAARAPAPTSASAPAGPARLLAVPRSAVIDTGDTRIVYVESTPGVFDMKSVRLGPAAGDYYPVLEGLEEGDRVVTVGTFLIDAENRLNPMRVAAAPAAGAPTTVAPAAAASHAGHAH